jgi:hypothetical protein
MAGVFAELRGLGIGEVLARSLVMFCGFIPFFALRETARFWANADWTTCSSDHERPRNATLSSYDDQETREPSTSNL